MRAPSSMGCNKERERFRKQVVRRSVHSDHEDDEEEEEEGERGTAAQLLCRWRGVQGESASGATGCVKSLGAVAPLDPNVGLFTCDR